MKALGMEGLALVALGAALLSIRCACAAPEYLGKTIISGTASDQSGLRDVLDGGTPHDRLGGQGSAIDYTGSGSRYVLLPDRGPSDGATDYRCRVQMVDIVVVRAAAGWRVDANLASTVLLIDAQGIPYIGKSSALATRLDPEGIRIWSDGTFFVSDEYGPCILRFGASGRQTGRADVPDRFRIASPNGDPKKELTSNTRGRQPNRGMEGLAITPGGEFLVGIMQSPLIQDGALDAGGKRAGRNVRVLRINIQTNKASEFVYQLADPSYGISEILAVNDHEFLVIERDGNSGSRDSYKRIIRFDLEGATDVSQVQALPADTLPSGINPGRKSLFIDLLDPANGLAGSEMPEKLEGLAFGPNLPDGRRLLLITSDNDFIATAPTVIYAFAVDK